MKLFGKSDDNQTFDDDLILLEKSVEEADIPPKVRSLALNELDKLQKCHPSTAEYTIGQNYLDYLINLPWSISSEDDLDIKRAEAILDQEHFGLDRAKNRILEYLAVRTLYARSKGRILVVDDEEITRKNLDYVLSKEGYNIQTAANGEEALDVLDRHDFDIVLTDMKMGRVDGIQVLEHARIKNPQTQVVMITGYATIDSAVEVMKKGAFHYLTKPFKLDEVRETISRIVSEKTRTSGIRGPILCFVGPPGTGKTSLAHSIARALGRKFIRVSLAGMKDEAELRGHRRTYAGALPGRIIQEIRRAGVNNPVFLLDEVDKAIQGFKGDPTSALLEVLDPEQNSAFTDYYLDIPFDLSAVIFIATANIIDPIPPALLDRMEILALSGYTDAEKAGIALKFIVPKQIKENGLSDNPPEFTREAVLVIIREYTREAGLRSLEREVARLCRKLAHETLVNGSADGPKKITGELVPEYLGPRRYYHEVAAAVDRVGVATGLVWTENGGEIISVEATTMRGRSELILTGSLGDVMQESAQAALSFLRANTNQFGLEEDFFLDTDIHIHVPAGAIPKDGPSAGLTIALALLSRLKNIPAKRDAALTGELTLSGRVLPVGGIREKVLAAKRAGVKTLVFPEKNKGSFSDIPPEAYEGMDVYFVDSLEMAAVYSLVKPE